jgi:TDG/mug DNA glycosylase family protein
VNRPGAAHAGRTPADTTAADTTPADTTPAGVTEPDSPGPGPAPRAGGSGRPSREDLLAAADRTIPDLIGPGLRVLFCGINPSLYSAATGHHFARPGNRFWPALHRSGFTPRLLHPSEQDELLRHRLGITNMVARASARADELSPAELVTGGQRLTATVARWRPGWLAVVGVTAYRTAFGRPRAAMGRQADTVAGAPVWVLPNPSGLNAHYTVDSLAAAFAELRVVAGRGPSAQTSSV